MSGSKHMAWKSMNGCSFVVGFASCLLLFGFNDLQRFGGRAPEAMSAASSGQRMLNGVEPQQIHVRANEAAVPTKKERRKEDREEMEEASKEGDADDEDETQKKEKGEEEGDEEEEEEEHFTTADVQVSYVVFGAVTIALCLFDLVNWDDDDIRLYTWSIVSMTISIFVAVLSFEGINQYVELLSEGMNPWIRVVFAYGQCLAYLFLMLFWISYESGMVCEPGQVDLDEETWTIADTNLAEHGRPLTSEEEKNVSLATNAETTAKIGLYSDEFGNQLPVMKRKLKLEQRLRRMKCYAGLLAHMAGFAAINAGGVLQHMHIFSASPVLCCVPILVTGALCQVVFSMSKAFRTFHLQAAIDAGRAGRRAKLCEESVEEAENDVMGLSLSFLVVQVLRFSLTGVLPNLEGVEVPEIKIQWQAVAGLVGCAAVFACKASCLAVLLVQSSSENNADVRTAEVLENREDREASTSAATAQRDAPKEQVGNFTFMERLGPTGMSAMAMCFAWSLLFATRWICVNAPFVNLRSMMGTIQLALILSLVAGFSVFMFDKADDFLKARGDSEAGSLAITTIINALALLVGFTWEKCFDYGVQAISTDLGGAGARGMKFALAIVVGLFVIRPWRRYILTKVLYLEILKKHRIHQLRQRASQYLKLETRAF